MVCTQPWRCVCRGSVQMTMTRPCRRMILHLLQIFFTLGLTFIVFSSEPGPRPRRMRVVSQGSAAVFAAAFRCLRVRYL